MEQLKSRREKLEELAANTKSSLKKKVVATTLVGTLLFGGTAAFGAMNPAFLTQISDFVTSIFNTKNSEITNIGNSESTADVSSLETFLTDLKARIQSEVGGWGDTEKTRVTNEIQGHHDELQTQADAQATTDISDKKAALTQTANTEISEGNAALDAKFNELFPTTTP